MRKALARLVPGDGNNLPCRLILPIQSISGSRLLPSPGRLITDGSMVEKASCEVSYGFMTFMAKKELGWFIYQIDWRNKSSAVFSSFAPT